MSAIGSIDVEGVWQKARLANCLNSGQDDGSAQSWLTTTNLDLGERPFDLLSTVRGLLRTSDYVDALCARV